ncbi:hypothetical protein PLICRDRAFT_461184 [Plicaturopsis crispa FD-325 SS-3]|nr:hypothetical protein PLICRDRAFT_461184 [Plicaturopsis crispa FD-325 SS-3]
MSECDVRFSKISAAEAGSFKMLELPPEICKLIEIALDNADSRTSLTIKGASAEDAVLCTSDKTYALRSVVLSNTVLVATRGDDDGVVIRDQLNEIIELVPAVPKLYRLNALLRGMEYDEGQEDGEVDSETESNRPIRKRITYDDARAEIQASEDELARGIRERHILILNGELRPIAPDHLNTILELILNCLVALSLQHDAASVEDLTATLADEHEVPRTVSTQVMEWFGEIQQGLWKMDIRAVATQMGLGILRHHKDEPIQEPEFISKWKKAVGDSFESSISLDLLSGNYLSTVPPNAYPPVAVLTYFPSSSLPVDPAARFADLFITRSRWKNEDIAPFLADIAVDAKERDKLLLKYARATTDTQGVWYTARAKYNG